MWRVRVPAKPNGALSSSRGWWCSDHTGRRTPLARNSPAPSICRQESTTCARAFIRSSRFVSAACATFAYASSSGTVSRSTPSTAQRRQVRPFGRGSSSSRSFRAWIATSSPASERGAERGWPARPLAARAAARSHGWASYRRRACSNRSQVDRGSRLRPVPQVCSGVSGLPASAAGRPAASSSFGGAGRAGRRARRARASSVSLRSASAGSGYSWANVVPRASEDSVRSRAPPLAELRRRLRSGRTGRPRPRVRGAGRTPARTAASCCRDRPQRGVVQFQRQRRRHPELELEVVDAVQVQPRCWSSTVVAAAASRLLLDLDDLQVGHRRRPP